MKILWQSNSPHTPSGYGNQTALFTPLLGADHELTIFAYYGVEGAPLRCKGIEILPRAHDAWGNDIVTAHCLARQIDLLITLMDVWVLEHDIYGALNWLAWTPVDHDPLPPAVRDVLKAAKYPVAMSRFGQRMMAGAGITANYVPHGVDTSIFKPVDRRAARRALGLEEGRFIAMMNAANKGDPSRKSFREVLLAWSAYIKEDPDALLYLHTDQIGVHGVPLMDVVKLLGLEDHVRFADAYRYAMGMIKSAELNLAYNAADVLLNPSMGEGFGIAILEAQAAGCPVIVSDFSAMSELCLAGWKVGGTPFMTYQNAMQIIPSVEGIVEALRAAKAQQNDTRLRTQAVEAALVYDVRRVYAEYWCPLLEQVAEELTQKIV